MEKRYKINAKGKMLVRLAELLHLAGVQANLCPRDYSAQSWEVYRFNVAKELMDNGVVYIESRQGES